MTHFIERKHLLQWLAKNCTRKSVVRAMDEGTVEHLGAFTKLGPNGNPGWITKVMSDTGKVWFVQIVVSIHSKRHGIFILEDKVEYADEGFFRVKRITKPVIPWEHWSPSDHLFGGEPLYDGDNPIESVSYTHLTLPTILLV